MDYKQKILSKKQNESQVDYFGKSGMSFLGAMLVRKNEDGEFMHNFIDCVIYDSASQGGKDLLPPLEAIFKHIAEYFKETTCKTLIIVSDNATNFTGASLFPFIHSLNANPELPSVKIWMYSEPQRGKTLLDTHFSFVTLKLNQALLAGIPHMNTLELYKALTYRGGLSATSVLLVACRDDLDDVFSKCEKAQGIKGLRNGISQVHEIQFHTDDNKLTTHLQYGLPQHSNTNTERWETKLLPCSTVLKQYVSDAASGLVFGQPSKGSREEVRKNAGTTTLPTLLQDVVAKAQSGMNENLHQQATETRAIAATSLPSTFTLEKRWTKKKNRKYLNLSPEVKDQLDKMYEQGVKDSKNKVKAEAACLELKSGILEKLWDQKKVCTVAKIKSYFAQKKLKGKKKSSQPATAENPSDDDCDNCEEDIREDDLTVIPEEENDEPDVVPLSHLE